MMNYLSLLFLILAAQSPNIWGRDFVVFSVMQDLPMGEPDEIIHKDYYINMGLTDGVKKGTVLDVFRGVLKTNPYDENKQFSMDIPMAKLKVIYSENNICIARVEKFPIDQETPSLDVGAVMIGDKVKVALE